MDNSIQEFQRNLEEMFQIQQIQNVCGKLKSPNTLHCVKSYWKGKYASL